MVGHGLVGGVLHAQVDGGVDRQAAGLDELLALGDRVAQRLVVVEPVEHVVAEERRPGEDATVVGVDRVEAEALLLQLLGLAVLDDAQLGHPVEHDVAALEGPVGVVGRVEAGRVLHQPGQHGRLAPVEVLGVLVEVVLGGRLDAVGAVAEVGEVEVPLEDPVLGVVLLEGDGVAQLAHLAGVGVVRGLGLLLLVALRLGEQGHLHHLLGDRRPALHHAVVGLVGDQRPQRALQVEGAVLVVAVVLDRDDRLDHLAGDLAEGDVDAVLVEEGRDHVAGGVDHHGALGQGLGLELGRQLGHPRRDLLGADAEDAREGDRQARGDQSHDRRHGEHDHDVAEHSGCGQSFGPGTGHGRKSTGLVTSHRFRATRSCLGSCLGFRRGSGDLPTPAVARCAWPPTEV